MKNIALISSLLLSAVLNATAAVDLVGFDGRTNSNTTLKQVFFDLKETSATWGGTINVNYGVHNQGSTAAGAFTVKFYLSTDTTIGDPSDYVFFTVPVSSMGGGSIYYIPGFEQPMDLPAVNPLSGSTFYIGMVVDADNQVSESNEANNKNVGDFKDKDTTAITIVPPTPNIQITDDIAPATDRQMTFGSVPNDGTGGASTTRTVSIFNNGTKALSVTGISLTTGSHFKIDRIVSNIQKLTQPPTFPRSLGADSSETWSVVVKCDPAVTASVTDTLTVRSDDPDSASVTVALSATGIPSPEIQLADSTAPATDRTENFGEVNADGTGKSTSTRTVTITNPGTGPLTINQNGLSFTTGTHFRIVSVTSSTAGAINLSTGSRTMAAASAEKWSVVLTFDPLADGDLADSLKVSSNDADEPSAAFSLIGRGRPMGILARIGTPTFAPAHADGSGKEMSTFALDFRNDGEVALTFPASPFRFLPTTHFRVTQVRSSARGILNMATANQSMAPNKAEIWSVTLAFDPTSAALTAPGGVVSTDFTYLFNSPLGSPTPVSTTLTLSGTALSVPDIKISEAVGTVDDLIIPFGKTEYSPIGLPLTKTLTLKNVGTQPLVFEQNGITSSSSLFTVKSITSAAKRTVNLAHTTEAYRTLLPAQADTWTVTLVFSPPTQPGIAPLPDPNPYLYPSTLTLRSNDPDEQAATVALNGEIDDTFVDLLPGVSASTAPTRFLIAGEPMVLNWNAHTPRSNPLIDIYRDTDDDHLNGWTALATSRPYAETGSYTWTPTTAQIGQRHYYAARLRFTTSSHTVVDYTDLPYTVIAASSKPTVRSQLTTASQDYAWEVDVGGTVFTGTTTLENMGQNVVSAPVVINGVSGIWEFTVNRVASMLDAKGYTYDEMQRPKTFTNGNGITTTYTYDLAGRLIKTSASNGAVVEYTYDAASRMISMKDATGYTFYERDTLDRMTAYIMSTNSVKGDADDIRLTYLWDSAGRRTGIIYPGGERMSYTFDAAGRMLTAVNLTRKLTFTFEYNPTNGLLTALNRPNGIRTTYSYDGSARVTRITHKRGATTVADYLYTLNAAGQATSFTSTQESGATAKEQYTYDNAGRLTQVIYSDDDGVIEASDKKLDYTYDGNGNRLTQTATTNSVVTERRTYTYGNENRLLRVVNQAGDEIARYTYDAAGNRTQTITSTETISFSYDERNLLTKITTPTSTRILKYNGAGQRVGEIVDGVESRLVNDVLMEAYEVVQRRSTKGVVLASRSLGVGGELVSYVGAVASVPLQDRLGSFRAWTTTTGAVTGTETYNVFGKADTPSTTRGFAGEEHIGSLQFLRARFYDPATGVFLGKDPLGVASGMNFFTYASNDPVNKLDSTGQAAQPAEIKTLGPVDWFVGKLLDNGVAADSIINTSQQYINISHAGVAIADSYNPVPDFGYNELKLSYWVNEGAKAATGRSAIDYDNSYYKTTDTLMAIKGINDGLTQINKGYGQVVTSGQFQNAAAYDRVTVLGHGSYTNLSSQISGAKAADNFIINPISNASRSIEGQTAIASNTIGYGKYYTANEMAYLGTQGTARMVGGATQVVGGAHTVRTNVGGVLIDKAAQFIGANLSDIRGASFDPSTGQIVFLGTENASATKDVNMDYIIAALQAVYGSFTPPFVSLDPPVTRLNNWTDFGDGDGVMEPKEWGGFTLRYNPIWSEQDNYIDVRIRSSWNGTRYTTTIRLNTRIMNSSPIVSKAGDRYGMQLVFASGTGMPPGLQFDSSDFSAGRLHRSYELTETSQDSYWPFFFYNNGTQNYIIESVELIPDKQHRRYGGRLEGTKLGWVLYEADRVMKCLSVGKDNLTGATYSSSTVPVTGYKNMIERIKAGGTGGDIRMWFVPNEMNLKRHVDPVSGRAAVIFDKSTVSLLTESFLAGVPATPIANDFANHFTNNYDAFAARTFPVQDPTDPTGATIINVKIFEMLREAMQAVSLARFFRDNNIPLDMWWLNQWTPPAAYTPKSVATAYNEDTTGGGYIVIYGGVEVQKPNAYIPSTTAKSVADTILSGRPVDAAKPTEDGKGQTWTASTSEGSLRAVAASFQAEQQDGNVDFPETLHSFASPGFPLTIGIYYSSSWLGKDHLGPGWRCQRYQLEFSHPSIYDESGYTNLPKLTNGDTQLRRGEVRLVDLATGTSLDFTSSLQWSYGVSNLGHPLNTFSGLNSRNLPTFTPGLRSDGTLLFQDDERNYTAVTPSDEYLHFDSNGRLWVVTDKHGHTHTYGYDTSTNLLSTITDDEGQELQFSYDANQRLTSVIGPDGVGVTFVFDGSGRLSQVVKQPSNVVIRTYTYNSQNQLQTVTDMYGVKRLGSTPDERGRMDQGQDARGNTTDMKFFRSLPGTIKATKTVKSKDPASSLGEASAVSDMVGRTLAATNPYGSTTSFEYANGALAPTSIRLPTAGRPAITVARNTHNLPTQIHDPAVTGASPVTITYNDANKPTKVVDQLKRSTLMAYSPTNDVTKITRYLGTTAVSTSMEYANGYVSAVTNPLGHKVRINRDALGRTTSVVDPTGVTISYEYDTRGRLFRVNDPKLSSPITYAYDDLDRVTSVTTPAGTTTYQYDPVKKWLTKVTDALSRSISYTYNNTTGDVAKTSVELSPGNLLDTTFSYNRVGGIQSITPPGSLPIGFNFDDGGLLMGTYETGGIAPGAPQNVISNNALTGVPTTNRNHVFTWGAPYSDLPITAYSFAFDAVPDNTPESTGATATYNNVSVANHTFQVKARDSAGRWGSVAVFNLNVVASLPSPAPMAAMRASTSLSVASWKQSAFSSTQLANASISDDLADPDKDGLENLLEYGLGTPPMVPSSEPATAVEPGVPVMKVVNGKPTLCYRRDRRKTDIQYVTQWSSDLKTWHTEDISETTTPIDGNNEDEVTSTCNHPEGRFLRLQVVRP